jgi:hypothetical protein
MGYREMRNYYTVIGILKGTKPFVTSRRNVGGGSIKMMVKEIRSDVQTGFSWITIGYSSKLFLTYKCALGSH